MDPCSSYSRFDGSHEDMKFVGGLLSLSSLERVQQGMQRLAKEFNELVEADASLPLAERYSCAAVLAARPWVFSHFMRLEQTHVATHTMSKMSRKTSQDAFPPKR
jgi:hypothetical protein